MEFSFKDTIEIPSRRLERKKEKGPQGLPKKKKQKTVATPSRGLAKLFTKIHIEIPSKDLKIFQN